MKNGYNGSVMPISLCGSLMDSDLCPPSKNASYLMIDGNWSTTFAIFETNPLVIKGGLPLSKINRLLTVDCFP